MPGPLTKNTTCHQGQWTRIYAMPTLTGGVTVWSLDGSVQIDWRRYASDPPQYFQGSATVDRATFVWTGTPAGYLEFWVNPQRTVKLRAA
jgi:hypothetical protein